MRFAAQLALLTPVAAATLGWMAAPAATARPLTAGRPTPAAVGLDTELRALAGKLGVSVRNEADEQQLGRVVELSALSGAAYDAAFVTLLRSN